jgi:threonine dehydrogenase-like Zn-dependent dehydrogenase
MVTPAKLAARVPDCTILATSSPKHHNHITALGADGAFDRNAASLAQDAKSATKQSQGVDAIIDAVGAASTQRHILEAVDPTGPRGTRRYGLAMLTRPCSGSARWRRCRAGGTRCPPCRRCSRRVDTAYRSVHAVGAGLDGLKKGLELMRKGVVSGEKLVAAL